VSATLMNILQVLSAATLIAKHTSSLCNTCRMASSKTANPVAKRHFVQSAKDVANSTANLVRAIKVSAATRFLYGVLFLLEVAMVKLCLCLLVITHKG